jgi:uncharacterized membrane protein
MEEAIKDAVHSVVPIVEAISALVICVGVAVAFVRWALSELNVTTRTYEEVRLLLGRYLALGLEFALGADILATVVAPSWEEIGKLAAIAGIRTALNFFLERELERAAATGASTG